VRALSIIVKRSICRAAPRRLASPSWWQTENTALEAPAPTSFGGAGKLTPDLLFESVRSSQQFLSGAPPRT
jgi:hypothetical protein